MKSQNLKTVCFFALLFAVSMFFHLESANGQTFLPEQFTPAQSAEYERQLNAQLKTTRPSEKEFVSKVIKQINDGKIPSKLVSTSYQWIVKKRPNTKYPFIYFERVLRLQAKALKLESEIPPFDFDIYGSLLQGSTVEASQTVESSNTEIRQTIFSRVFRTRQ